MLDKFIKYWDIVSGMTNLERLLMKTGMFFATTFCIKLQKGFVGCCTYIL